MFFVVLLVAVIIFSVFHNLKKRENEMDVERQAEYEKALNIYKEKVSGIAVPGNIYRVYIRESGTVSGLITGLVHYCWLDKGMIHFFPEAPMLYLGFKYTERSNWGLVSIPISSVNVYTLLGEFYRETQISGGGSNTGSAIAGAILFGEVGAIIGGSPNEIKSETVEHDTRATQLSIDFNNQSTIIILDKCAYEIFQILMPEKDATIVNEVRHRLLVEQQLDAQRVKEIIVPHTYGNNS